MAHLTQLATEWVKLKELAKAILYCQLVIVYSAEVFFVKPPETGPQSILCLDTVEWPIQRF